MKKILTAVLCLLMLFALWGCSDNGATRGENEKKDSSENPHHDMITEAVTVLEEQWRGLYAGDDTPTDGHFQIVHTRVITLKENKEQMLADVAYIIEFELRTDWFGSAPYYVDAGVFDNVVVRKDGSMRVDSHLLNTYRNMTYNNDFSGFIEAVDDYGSDYNCEKKLV